MLDFQASFVENSLTQTVQLRDYLSNIPEVTWKGFETDVTAITLPDLSARTNYAYSDGGYSKVQTAATMQCSLSSRRLASLPRFAMTAGLDYTQPVGTDEVFVQVDTASRSGYDGDPSLSRFTYSRGHNLTIANIGYRLADGLELIVWARNLLDVDYIQNLMIQAGNSGLILGSPSDPRTVGVILRFRM